MTDMREPTAREARMLTGDSTTAVLRIGTMTVYIRDHRHAGKRRELLCKDTYFVPDFHTSLVSHAALRKNGMWWHGGNNELWIGEGNRAKLLCKLEMKYRMSVVEYDPLTYFTFLTASPAVFAVPRKPAKRATRPPRYAKSLHRTPRVDIADLWHERAGHPGPRVLEHLASHVNGARLKGPSTVKCAVCAVSKAKNVVSRRKPSRQPFRPFERIHLDLFGLERAYNGARYAMAIMEEFTGHITVYAMVEKSDAMGHIIDFESLLKRQLGLSISSIRLDNETSLINPPEARPSDFQRWATDEGISLELAPPHTKEPNGRAERTGGVLIDKARAMRVSARLPENLWPEIWQAAAYLHNRVPREQQGNKAPLQMLYEWLRARLVPPHLAIEQLPQEWQDWLTSLIETTLDTTKVEDLRPDWSGIYRYGCRAYPLAVDFKHRDHKHFKMTPKAHVGYLVGYRATNIYRIWIPVLEQIITTRDVTFDEELLFDKEKEDSVAELITEYKPLIESMKMLEINSEDFVVEESTSLNDVRPNAPSTDSRVGAESSGGGSKALHATVDDGIVDAGEDIGLPTPDGTPEGTPEPSQPTYEANSIGKAAGDDMTDTSTTATLAESSQRQEGALPSINGDKSRSGITELVLPVGTPETASNRPQTQKASRKHDVLDTSLIIEGSRSRRPTEKAIAAHDQRRPKEKRMQSAPPGDAQVIDEDSDLVAFLAAFHGARQERGPQVDTLPTPPKRFAELKSHQYGGEMHEACDQEWESLRSKGTFTVVDRSAATSKILPLKWVFTYKNDEEGYYTASKARIVVRGDLQPLDIFSETRATTLASKSFRVMMAIAAKFDLEIKQFDVRNAFLNADLEEHEEVYCEMPDGYKLAGRIIKLLKALYGLRRSPLLWWKELSKALEEFGLTGSLEDPCVFSNDGIILFFYVDDIAILYRKEDSAKYEAVRSKLCTRFKVKEEGDIKWFLGMRIHRDRLRRKLWICRSTYIEKVARKFSLQQTYTRWPSTPCPTQELENHDGQATASSIKVFQEKVGSILYAAIMTRPDVARAAAELSKHLRNPSSSHQAVADQVIRYLYATRYISLCFDGHSSQHLIVASDASFADDSATRHSSQGYVILLFGGPVAWKASKQDTVTTSTTEAELLALTTTIKEGYSLQRLFRDVDLDIDEPLKLFCDNKQTIRLVVKPNERISTKLKHIDIHNLWARQEYGKGRFNVEYMETSEMPADGLTKNLPRGSFERFRNQLNLDDIRHLIGYEEKNRKDDDGWLNE
jgi:transposase InsO family protein